MRAKFIYNPSSGKQIIQKNLDRLIGNLILEGGLRYIDVFATQKRYDALEEVKNMKEDDFDLIIGVGGDGTINEVVNGIMKGKHKTPIAILPAGTVNDFANWMNIPSDIKGFCQMIRNRKMKMVDVGKIGDRYFINVAAGGLLTDVGYKVSSDAKTVLGKFAYFVEGMREIPKQMFKSISLEVDSENFKGKEDVLMFIVTNTPIVGGFRKIAPMAKDDDGLLDVCIIKKSDLPEFFSLFVQTMKGEHICHPKVSYIQTPKIEFKCCEELRVELDLDGEQGGCLPATIEVVPKSLNVIIP